MSPSITAKVFRHLAGKGIDTPHTEANPTEVNDLLTPREREIMTLLGKGLNTISIAKVLYLSEKTIRNHINHIYERIGVHDRAQAVIWAIKHGLVD